MLTQQQAKALLFIIDYQSAHGGTSPSYQEIASALGVKMRSNAKRVVDALQRRGFIRHIPEASRSIEVLRTPPGADTRDAVIEAATRLLESVVIEDEVFDDAVVSAAALGDLDIAISELRAAR